MRQLFSRANKRGARQPLPALGARHPPAPSQVPGCGGLDREHRDETDQRDVVGESVGSCQPVGASNVAIANEAYGAHVGPGIRGRSRGRAGAQPYDRASGNSGVGQYVESIPTAGGSRPTNTVHPLGGGSNSGLARRRLELGGARTAAARAHSARQAAARAQADRMAAARVRAVREPTARVQETHPAPRAPVGEPSPPPERWRPPPSELLAVEARMVRRRRPSRRRLPRPSRSIPRMRGELKPTHPLAAPRRSRPWSRP